MTNDTHALTMLDTLLQADPALKSQLGQASDIEHFMQLVTASAQRHGMTLDAGELQAQLQARLDQASAAGDLTEQQLEAVAGGHSAFLEAFHQMAITLHQFAIQLQPK